MDEWREELGKRRRSSKTRRLFVDEEPTNKYSLDATIGPMHYEDAEGDFQDINAELVPSTRSIVGFGNPAYEMIENEYEMFVLGELNSGVPLVRYVSKNTEYWVQFAAHNLVWTNDLDQIDFISTPATTPTEVSGNESRWPDAYGSGIDLRYIAGRGRMSKWLDINSPLASPPQFIIDGGNPVIEFAEILEFHAGLEVWINGVEWNKRDEIAATAEIEFRSPDGEVQFVFPVATGYHEGEEDNHIVGQLRLKKQGPRLYVTVRFPYLWLQSATYPVHLDTDVDKQVGAGGDDGRRRTGTDGFDNTVADNAVGYYASAQYLHMHMFARWTGVSIEGTIGASYVECYAHTNPYGDPELKVYGVDEDNPVAPTDATEFDADPLTTAGVDWDGSWTIDNWAQSPSLNSIFQELVDTYTISNEAVMVQIKNDHAAVLYHYNSSRHWDYAGNAHGPKLHIEYSAAAAGTPQQMMHYMRMRKE